MFEYAVRGRQIDAAVPPPYLTNSDRLVYRPFVTLRAASPRQTSAFRWVELHLDTGGDCVFLRERYAHDLHLLRPGGMQPHVFHTAAGPFSAWFTEVTLTLGYPNNPNLFAWTAPVGFVPNDSLPVSARSGILGIGGGLERFLRVELVLSPGGIEMPVVRIATPDP